MENISKPSNLKVAQILAKPEHIAERLIYWAEAAAASRKFIGEEAINKVNNLLKLQR